MFDIFQPRATKAVLAAMAALKFGFHEPVVSDYRGGAASLIRKQPKRTESTLANVRNPSAVALLVLLEELEDDIATGRHHVYRGMLGTGGSFLTAAHAEIVRQLRECNALTDGEVHQAMANLREAIEAAG